MKVRGGVDVAKRDGKGETLGRWGALRKRPLAAGALIVLLFLAGVAAPDAGGAGVPSFGKGKVQVRLYTDYFCGPCSRAEPKIEVLLADLVGRNAITLTLVDTPIHASTPLYAKYFLYMLNNDSRFANALHYRALLFEAAKNNIGNPEKLEEFLKSNNVGFTRSDLGPTLAALSSLITEDGVRSTPTCVIVRDGQKSTFVGDADIIKALEQLQKALELLK